MIIDLKVTLSSGLSVVSTGWPDQPVIPLFKHVLTIYEDAVLVEVQEIHHG
jgi:hypothetical protein